MPESDFFDAGIRTGTQIRVARRFYECVKFFAALPTAEVFSVLSRGSDVCVDVWGACDVLLGAWEELVKFSGCFRTCDVCPDTLDRLMCSQRFIGYDVWGMSWSTDVWINVKQT